MTVDEALAIVETVLDDDEQLNDIQELIFKQCWEGRHSYEAIAKLSQYDDEYIKAAGYKLWKLLSEAFEEKVKKNNIKAVIKRYLRRQQITLHRTQSININLRGANLSGATLNLASLIGTRLLLTNFSESASCQEDLNQALLPDSLEGVIESQQSHNQRIESNREECLYHWNNLRFRCEEQVKIAEALDRANIFFFPNSQARLTTPEGRQNQEPDFFIFHQGKLGILEIWHPDTEKNQERDRDFASAGICTIYYCEAHRCSQEADRVVQEFLELLSHP
jgi:hypothetical protein